MASDVNCCSECTVAKLDHDGAVKVGDVILSEDPWVYTLSELAIDQRCYRCLGLLRENHGQKQQPVNRCSGCSYVRYCSTECQVGDDTNSSFRTAAFFNCTLSRGWEDLIIVLVQGVSARSVFLRISVELEYAVGPLPYYSVNTEGTSVPL